MLFQIEESDRFESAYADFLERVQNAMQQTYCEEQEARGLTKTAMAAALGVDLSVVSRRLNGIGNITLRTISDTYTAMNREPLSNFVPPRNAVEENDASDQHPAEMRAKRVPVSMVLEIQSEISEVTLNSPKPFMVDDKITNVETSHPIGTGPSGSHIKLRAAA
jgi:transcriptional regulator with XRE-family HTH domain